MRELFKGQHEAVFVTAKGKKIAFKYVTENMLGSFTKTMASMSITRSPSRKVAQRPAATSQPNRRQPTGRLNAQAPGP
jgi:hypothetical protein